MSAGLAFLLIGAPLAAVVMFLLILIGHGYHR